MCRLFTFLDRTSCRPHRGTGHLAISDRRKRDEVQTINRGGIVCHCVLSLGSSRVPARLLLRSDQPARCPATSGAFFCTRPHTVHKVFVRGLTIHSSRTCFASRLNSGVRRARAHYALHVASVTSGGPSTADCTGFGGCASRTFALVHQLRPLGRARSGIWRFAWPDFGRSGRRVGAVPTPAQSA